MRELLRISSVGPTLGRLRGTYTPQNVWGQRVARQVRASSTHPSPGPKTTLEIRFRVQCLVQVSDVFTRRCGSSGRGEFIYSLRYEHVCLIIGHLSPVPLPKLLQNYHPGLLGFTRWEFLELRPPSPSGAQGVPPLSYAVYPRRPRTSLECAHLSSDRAWGVLHLQPVY
jgi:hypothetical protein